MMNMVFVVRVILGLGSVLGVLLLFKIWKMIRVDRRIARYSLSNRSDENISLFDQVHHRYITFTSRFLKNQKLKNYAKHYERYASSFEKQDSVLFIINKLMIGISFLLLIVVSSAIQGKAIGLFGYLFSFIVGYYLYDIYLIYRKKSNEKKIKNDMLRAVIIMNNAFKAGKSILQAVELASRDLPKPISFEFRRIYQDMAYGLSADVAFARFANRVSVEEANYVSSSLTILNKTGGNIVMVFSSIERTLFDKKKLESDLKNSTAASNLVVKVLMVIPILFVLVIYVVSPGYFDPFFTSGLGYMMLGVLALMFTLYIYLLNKIMKVRV